ncbi:urease accessory protein [Niallia nealsonii]|uniref:Urease accessory protein UreD n=2 Tax=Niallia nealsonii TaxID=115979 RepID=A0A2N0YZ52_9BACI|nr:urease accessory protein [Niallia nealsonii]
MKDKAVVTGKLALTFEKRREKTRLVDCFQAPPLKASRTLYSEGDDQATVYLVETSGGLVAGDLNEYEIKLKEGARVCLIPQSATKVYPSYNEQTSKQKIMITLDKHTFLEWNKEEIIPFEQAKYEGSTLVRMEDTSTFLFAEIIYPGREKRGESFRYRMLSTQLQIWVEDSCWVYDPLKIFPEKMQIEKIGLLEGFMYIASVWVITPKLEWTENQLQALLPSEDKNHVVGVTNLKNNGLLVRWLSSNLPRIKKEIEQIFKKVKERI